MIYTNGLKMAAAAQKLCNGASTKESILFFVAYGYVLSPVSEDKICLQEWYDGISLVR